MTKKQAIFTMPKKRTKRLNTGRAGKQKNTASEAGLERLEFHRNAVALLPDSQDRKPGTAFMILGSESMQRFCTCTVSESKTCAHALELKDVYQAFREEVGAQSLEEDFSSSIWYRLARVMADGCRDTPQRVRLQIADDAGQQGITVFDSHGEKMLSYFSQGRDAHRFMERCGNPPDRKAGMFHRGVILESLGRLTLTANERLMLEQGLKTRGQALQENFWYRVAYHGYRELGRCGGTFQAYVDPASGSFRVDCGRSAVNPVLRMHIPRIKVKRILNGFKALLPGFNGLTIHPVRLQPLFKVTRIADRSIEIRPFLQLKHENGQIELFEREGLERYRYGNLFFLNPPGILAELEQPVKTEKPYAEPRTQVIDRSQIPSFLEKLAQDLPKDSYALDSAVQNFRIFKKVDRARITPETVDRDWYWLSVEYGFGNTNLSLSRILRARREGERFIETPEGWVDCESRDLHRLNAMLHLTAAKKFNGKSNRLKFSRMDLFRIKATGGESLQVTGNEDRVSGLQRILDMKPSTPLPAIEGMTSRLRTYQKLGVQWIRFLFENGFGGLLCDDMGLGKTHQVMAFMLLLRKQNKQREPFLVVCPTTVLSHWRNKLHEHAPGLKIKVYHGGQRNLAEALTGPDVLLTSYGILRKDIKQLQKISFALAVFDEIQYIKNPETLAFAAASEIRASMKLGLTGTPIENSLNELKALMDLTVPGYLGSDDQFVAQYVNPIEHDPQTPRREELRRLISPFTLRRLKKTVLSELPEKIEDIRTCRLSDDQIKLYRDAIAGRGQGLLEVLRRGKDPVPYIHVFALLTLLKQICNHPALLKKSVENYSRYASGKWDLFKELITESIESGQKVVVYSQFLGMIRIMSKFLEKQGVGFVTLTGGSRNRGRIISRFNDDPNCRVYVGSLKAGGAGIDLVAASVVIHYDRWWNAAREDQATDRVHRIGQKRGVQVFKLVTEGTLEEKISEIIQKKRNLMDRVITEDDPGLLKTFTREHLIELLSTSDLVSS